MKNFTCTHRGWFGLCPVYADITDPEVANLVERIPHTGWFLSLNLAVYDALANLAEMLGREVGFYPILITGELNEPIVFKEEGHE